MKSTPLPSGKLPAESLQRLLAALPRADGRVIVGPQMGEDAAVISMGDRYLVITTDPITFATDRIGWYAVHVNANDVAVMGARPRWFFAVLLLPESGASEVMVESIMADIRSSCAALGVTVCGGHTEITGGLERPIIVGQMLGEVERDRLISKGSVGPGDRILVTRGAAIEGTAILARERVADLRGHLSDSLLRRAERLLFDPGISIVSAALAAAETGCIHAMHDATEGGIQTGLYEIAVASGHGIRVNGDRIPILPETQAISELLEIDPLRLISSGALLIATPPDHVKTVTAALASKGIPTTEIAEVLPQEAGLTMERRGQTAELCPADRDEIARVFEGP